MSKKLDGTPLLIADPPPSNSNTMYSRLGCQLRSLCLCGTAYLPGPAKSPFLLDLRCNKKNILQKSHIVIKGLKGAPSNTLKLLFRKIV